MNSTSSIFPEVVIVVVGGGGRVTQTRELEQYFIVSRRDTQEEGGSRNYQGSSRPSVKNSTLFSIALTVSFALLFHNAHAHIVKTHTKGHLRNEKILVVHSQAFDILSTRFKSTVPHGMQ